LASAALVGDSFGPPLGAGLLIIDILSLGNLEAIHSFGREVGTHIEAGELGVKVLQARVVREQEKATDPFKQQELHDLRGAIAGLEKRSSIGEFHR
jgi:hypothetical protein